MGVLHQDMECWLHVILVWSLDFIYIFCENYLNGLFWFWIYVILYGMGYEMDHLINVPKISYPELYPEYCADSFGSSVLCFYSL